MGFVELLLTGIGLSMDAFAIAICHGLNMRKINYRNSAVIALFFGGFQALMPLVGWLLGSQFERYISGFDHWIVFGLLALIGGKMVFEALRGDDDDPKFDSEKLDIPQLCLMAIATSIDALAVGVSLAFLGANIAVASATIGVTTFIISFGGVSIGNHFGSKYKSKAEITGGVVLILIGLKVLIEHLMAGG